MPRYDMQLIFETFFNAANVQVNTSIIILWLWSVLFAERSALEKYIFIYNKCTSRPVT